MSSTCSAGGSPDPGPGLALYSHHTRVGALPLVTARLRCTTLAIYLLCRQHCQVVPTGQLNCDFYWGMLIPLACKCCMFILLHMQTLSENCEACSAHSIMMEPAQHGTCSTYSVMVQLAWHTLSCWHVLAFCVAISLHSHDWTGLYTAHAFHILVQRIGARAQSLKTQPEI